MSKTIITIESTINAPIEKVWAFWNEPEHVTKWNNASEDWHTTSAANDLIPGGSFNYRMEAKDGSFGFDFGGIYNEVTPKKKIVYTLGDGRMVTIEFIEKDNTVHIIEAFTAEDENPVEMQKNGWQSILDNFKKYAEIHS